MKKVSSRGRRIAFWSALVLAAALLAYGGWWGIQIWGSFQDVERVEANVGAARSRMETAPESALPEPPDHEATTQTTTPGEPDLTGLVGEQLPYDPRFAEATEIPDSEFQTFLVIGTDRREGLGGQRADVIMLTLLPADGSGPILISLPRDLYLPNPCHRAPTRINAALNGCGDLANGPELLAVMAADYTGIEADHFTLFDFDSFVRVIDAMGGVEVCVGPNPVREVGLFEFPEGCSVVTGAEALAWVRSRNTQVEVEGSWQPMGGVNDLTRTERQQDLLIAMLGKLSSFRELGALAAVVEELSDALVLDEGITVGEALGLGWGLRGVSPSSIRRVRPEVQFHTTPDGAAVLLPVRPFDEELATVYGS